MNNYMKIIINAMKQWTTDGLNRKVDKVPGKGLSTEDFTSELKNKLESMTPGSGGSGSGSGGGVDVQNAVLYVEQTLNADQRAQARENIGIEEEIAESLLALEIVKTFGDEDGAIAEDGTVLVARNDELFLPPVNEENEGNVLTVVDGKWAVEPVEFAGGGGPVDLKDLTFTGAVNAVYDGSRAVSVEIPEAPVKSVNGQTGDVTIELPEIEYPVTSVNGQTGEVVIDVPSVDGLATEEYVNEAIGAIEVPVTSVNGQVGDIVIDVPSIEGLATTSYVNTAVANAKVTVDSELNETSSNPVQNKAVTKAMEALATKMGDKTVQEQIDEAIQNLPEQKQADWSQSDTASVDYIKNKPEIDFNRVSLIDQGNGYKYHLRLYNGQLDIELACIGIEVAALPDKTTYFGGEEIDRTGMIINAIYPDGTVKQIEDYICEPLDFLGESSILVTYNEYGTIHTTTFNVVFEIQDFTYTTDADGNVILEEWKGTLNGEPSTDFVVPKGSRTIKVKI